MRTLLSQALTTATSTAEVLLAPGASAVVSATTANLANGTLSIEQSRTGGVWERARDVDDALVATLVGTGGAVLLAATRIKNEGTGPLRLRATLVATGSLAGTVTTVFVSARDSGATLPTEAGVGISNISTAVYRTSVQREGDFIRTRIFVDLTGLNGGGTADDIIGADGAGAAHIGRIVKSVNGAIIAGSVKCYVVPTTSNADVDLWSANESTGIEDSAISVLTGEVQLTNGGAHTLMREIALLALPVDGQYLYLTSGTATAATFGAGQLLIELIGVPAQE